MSQSTDSLNSFFKQHLSAPLWLRSMLEQRRLWHARAVIVAQKHARAVILNAKRMINTSALETRPNSQKCYGLRDIHSMQHDPRSMSMDIAFTLTRAGYGASWPAHSFDRNMLMDPYTKYIMGPRTLCQMRDKRCGYIAPPVCTQGR